MIRFPAEWMRAQAPQWFDTEVEVLRGGARVPDGRGGSTVLPPKVVKRLPAMFDTIQVAEQVGGGRTELIWVQVIHVPHGSDIRGTDVLRHSSGDYDVTGTNAQESHATTLAVRVQRRGE